MLTINENQYNEYISTRNLSTNLIAKTEDNTFVYFKSNKPVNFKVYDDRVEFYYKIKNEFKSTPSYVMFKNDIAGSNVCQEIISKQKNYVYLTIFAYPKEKYLTQNQSKRKRQIIKLTCNRYDNFVENLNLANEWHTHINDMLNGTKKEINNEINSSIENDSKSLESEKDLEKPIDLNSIDINGSEKNSLSNVTKSNPFLIYVNPKAGSGKAKDIYYKNIMPLMAEANLENTLVLTKYANFAKEHIQTLNINEYCGIVVVSGDGLIYEILNGLMERPDWKLAIKIPIAQIPGGSANALACCNAYLSKEVYQDINMDHFATQMTFNLIKSQSVPLDLVRVELLDKKVVSSFLSIAWGFIADLDKESEKYRFLGNARFTVGALQRISNLRVYRGRISFLPSDDMRDYKLKNSSAQLTHGVAHSDKSRPVLQYESFNYLRPLEEPVPEDWLILEDKFVLFLIVNLPLISPDFLVSPHASFNDGNMHMMFVREGITKVELLKVLTQPGDKHHLDNPHVEFCKIKAFRLEPLGLVNSTKDTGLIMVDGENVPYGKIQGEIMPGLGNAFIKNS